MGIYLLIAQDAEPDSELFSIASKMFVRLMESHLNWIDMIVIMSQVACLVAFVVLMFLKLDRVYGA